MNDVPTGGIPTINSILILSLKTVSTDIRAPNFEVTIKFRKFRLDISASSFYNIFLTTTSGSSNDEFHIPEVAPIYR